jgi:hypothetical protein
MTKRRGIIGCTFDREKDVYNFYLNTNRIASHRSSIFPVDDKDALRVFLSSIARTAATIVDFDDRYTADE